MGKNIQNDWYWSDNCMTKTSKWRVHFRIPNWQNFLMADSEKIFQCQLAVLFFWSEWRLVQSESTMDVTPLSQRHSSNWEIFHLCRHWCFLFRAAHFSAQVQIYPHQNFQMSRINWGSKNAAATITCSGGRLSSKLFLSCLPVLRQID